MRARPRVGHRDVVVDFPVVRLAGKERDGFVVVMRGRGVRLAEEEEILLGS